MENKEAFLNFCLFYNQIGKKYERRYSQMEETKRRKEQMTDSIFEYDDLDGLLSFIDLLIDYQTKGLKLEDLLGKYQPNDELCSYLVAVDLIGKREYINKIILFRQEKKLNKKF